MSCMSNLVIHPRDCSTAFLKKVYEDLDNVTVITHGVDQLALRRMIDVHDRVLMMGHGSPLGLFSVGQFKGRDGLIIDDSFADQLAERDNSVFIWCHADQYVRYNRLKGFYTGMFVSELSEARICRLPREVTDDHVAESNAKFVDVVNKFSRYEPRLIHAAATREYGVLAAINPVAAYNHQRLYWA